MQTLNILVLDDNLDAMRDVLKSALRYYADIAEDDDDDITMGAIHKSASAETRVRGAGSKPPLKIKFVSNCGLKEVHDVVAAIDSCKWDRRWDAIIIDDNWGTSVRDKSGTQVLLPKLRNRVEVERHFPFYLIFTQHFAEETRRAAWCDAIVVDTVSRERFRPLSKDNQFEFAEWLLRVALRRRDGELGVATVGAQQGGEVAKKPTVIEVVLSKSCPAVVKVKGSDKIVIQIKVGRMPEWLSPVLYLWAKGVEFGDRGACADCLICLHQRTDIEGKGESGPSMPWLHLLKNRQELDLFRPKQGSTKGAEDVSYLMGAIHQFFSTHFDWPTRIGKKDKIGFVQAQLAGKIKVL